MCNSALDFQSVTYRLKIKFFVAHLELKLEKMIEKREGIFELQLFQGDWNVGAFYYLCTSITTSAVV